jgi:hypothetical protein
VPLRLYASVLMGWGLAWHLDWTLPLYLPPRPLMR